MADLLWAAISSATEVLANASIASLADASAAMGSTTLDNTSNLHTFAVVSLDLGSATFTASSTVTVTLVPSFDDATYATASSSVIPGAHNTQVVFKVESGTGTRFDVSKPIPILPIYYRAHLYNQTGTALAATGNSVKIRTARLAI